MANQKPITYTTYIAKIDSDTAHKIGLHVSVELQKEIEKALPMLTKHEQIIEGLFVLRAVEEAINRYLGIV